MANNKYKSKHTGSQIDDAVSKVSSGEINGVTIQNGEITVSSSAPASDNSVVTKKYVDDQLSLGGKITSETIDIG